ncbi:hypothetical protein PNEG_04321 [Pneumocystis murina B123]|uniref:CAP-Gly domain-containing protein n=1 Tax=Pneumocystis murina (strain B123) TaxID=1069680 RepID=A0A0W4ZWX1_PNEMU|nr:hypothetical protein PNEG_04321 [Pneumocystis murina B123]KTW32860.1 hypothetical protein PNEG_04321 [Pneumocystis murina B123]
MSDTIGDRISFEGNCCTIKYIGPVKGVEGQWLGVEWDDPSRGKHNGTYLGENYFKCRKENSGSFIRQNRPRDIKKTFVDAFIDKYGDRNVEEYINFDIKSKNTNINPKIQEIYHPKNIQKKLPKRYIVTLDHMAISELGNIGEIKKKCSDILEIDLSGNLLNWKTVILIIKELPNLSSLKLNYNQLGTSELILSNNFKFSNLKTLILNKTYLKIKEIKKLCISFENLEELQISHNLLTLKTNNDFHFSDTIPHLKKIFLNDNKISCFETVTRIFGKLEKLVFLSLASNQINTINIIPNTFISLKYLDISKNNISEQTSLNNLNILHSLVSLRFTDNPLLKEFKSNPSTFIIPRLRNVMIINGTKITQEERQNAELYYLSTIEKEIKSGKISNYSDLIKEHPQWRELQKKYEKENPIFNTEKNLTEKIIENKLIELYIIFEKEIIKKKFISSMNIRSFRSFCAKFFKINPFDFTISYLEGSYKIIYIDDDSKLLSFYNLTSGETIYIKQNKPENYTQQ